MVGARCCRFMPPRSKGMTGHDRGGCSLLMTPESPPNRRESEHGLWSPEVMWACGACVCGLLVSMLVDWQCAAQDSPRVGAEKTVTPSPTRSTEDVSGVNERRDGPVWPRDAELPPWVQDPVGWGRTLRGSIESPEYSGHAGADPGVKPR